MTKSTETRLKNTIKALRDARDAILAKRDKARTFIRMLEKVTSKRHQTLFVTDRVPRKPGDLSPDGETWSNERWRKHWENLRRVEARTGVAPMSAIGWEKVACMLMDQLDGITEACERELADG